MDTDLEIFLQAPEDTSPEKISAYLDEACGDDAQLRERVEALFEADRVEQGIVDQAPKISEASNDPEGEGAIIHNYKLLQKIGEGGFGDVYMAEQFKPVKRRVALKIIKKGMDTRQVVARFEAERQALAMMDHPNIAKVHDGGSTELGRPYFVMELVRGIPITKFCDEQNLDTKERLDLFIDVCHAVQHAHQKGIIHRDLKPSNVMVTMHDDRPVVKVIDFGVAKATQTDLTDKTLFTKFDQFIGTPAYMSPEQAQFSGLDIDTRSDIYTLGVLLYELLTGSTPFDSKQMLTAGYDEIRRIIKEDEPELPSSRLSTFGKAELTSLAKHRRTAPARLHSLVKGDLDWIVMKSIEKDRTRRYDTANALAADISRHLEDEPVVAAAPSTIYRAKKYLNKHRALFTTAAVVIASLLIGTTVSIWKAVEANRASAQAEEATRSEEKLRKSAQDEKLIVQHRIAEEKLASGETALGIAHLARLVRDDHTNLVAAERLVSAIRENPQPQIAHVFDLPNATYAIFDDTGSKILIASLSGQVQVRDTVTGELLSPPIKARGQEMLEWIQFSPDGQHIILSCSDAADNRSTASLVDWKTGKEVHLPFELESKNQTCEISPDGQLLLMGCPGKARVWNLETGEPWKHSINEAGYMGTFSPDSSLVAFSNGKICDARTGATIPRLPGLANSYTISFSPDSKHTISSHPDGGVRIFEPRTGKLVKILRHEHPVSSANYSPDGRTIITASPVGELNLWDAVSYQALRKFELKDEKIISAQFSENGRWILCHTNFGNTYVWDPHLDTAPFLVAKAQNRVQFPAISPDGTLLLTSEGIRDGRIILHRIVPSQPMVQTFRHQESLNWDAGSQFVSVVNFSPSGDRIITGATENQMGIWDAWTGKHLQSLNQGGGAKFRAEFSPDGEHALTTSAKNGMAVWDSRDGDKGKLHSYNPYGTGVHATFSPTKNAQGHYLIVNVPEGGNAAHLYNATTGVAIGAPLIMEDSSEFQEPITCFNAAFSPDSTHLATASFEGHARIWRIADGEMMLELSGQHVLPVTTINYSPDGLRIVTASNDGTAVIWDAKTGAVISRLHHGSAPLNYAEFSPDNQSVVTNSSDGLAKIWDAQSGRQKGEPLKHDGFLRTARFSSDSLRIVTCSFDNTARLWDARTGLPLSGPFRHEGNVFWAAFSPDGTRVVTSGSDTLAHIWDFPPAPRGAVPDWVPDWAEAVAGIRIAENNAVERIVHEERRKFFDSVPGLPDDNYYAKTAKWLASDQDSRLITPFSKMSKETWVNNRIRENTIDSLEEALTEAPHNSEVALALTRALLKSPTGDRETNLGQSALLAAQAKPSPEQELLNEEIGVARAAHAFDLRVTRLEEEAIASADLGETTSLSSVHKTLILANFIAQSDEDFNLTTELRSPQELIDIEFQDFETKVFVARDSVWHYLDDNQPPPPNWTSPEFNHDSWQSGPTPLGYGEDQTTTLKGEDTFATAFYFRQRFDHQPHSSIARPTLSIRCDDGAVIYLNGKELLRFRMPEGPIAHDTEASGMAGTHNGARWHEAEWHDFVIEPDLLKEKDNLLAVEIHQKHNPNQASSDLYLALEFSYRPTQTSYLKQFDAETLTRGISQLSLALPPDLAPIYQERWQSAILPGVLPDDRESLDLRAKFLNKLQRPEDELPALEKLIALYPVSTDYSDFIVHINALRRISQCLLSLGREDESLAFRAQFITTIPPRPENLSPLMLDLSGHFNINFFKINSPSYWGSREYWEQRFPKIFDPGDGPDFDVRGVIQLNSGKYAIGQPWLIGKSYSYASEIPVLNKVKIEVDQTFGAIHFLQSCQELREHVGTEIAHYLIHYEDGPPARIPVIVGEGLMHDHFNGMHSSFIANIRHLAFEKSFRWEKGGNDTGKLGLYRQSWTNPHPEKRVTHLEFVSAKKQAAPRLLAVTLEPQEKVAVRNKDLPQKLQAFEKQLQNIPDPTEPASIRERRNLLREVVPLLEDLGQYDRARKLSDELFSIPPRPDGLSPKQIDLTNVYTESFFLPGINLSKTTRTLHWSRVPESLQTTSGIPFDARGVIQLNSGRFPNNSGAISQKDFDYFWPNACPDRVSIKIGQKFQHVHFLQSCRYNKDVEGQKIAEYVIHYDDGTKETIPVIFNENTFNNANTNLDGVTLAPDTKIALALPWRGQNGNENKIVFAHQTWANPHSHKIVTHIDFISAKKSAGPLVAGITVE